MTTALSGSCGTLSRTTAFAKNVRKETAEFTELITYRSDIMIAGAGYQQFKTIGIIPDIRREGKTV